MFTIPILSVGNICKSIKVLRRTKKYKLFHNLDGYESPLSSRQISASHQIVQPTNIFAHILACQCAQKAELLVYI